MYRGVVPRGAFQSCVGFLKIDESRRWRIRYYIL